MHMDNRLSRNILFIRPECEFPPITYGSTLDDGMYNRICLSMHYYQWIVPIHQIKAWQRHDYSVGDIICEIYVNKCIVPRGTLDFLERKALSISYQIAPIHDTHSHLSRETHLPLNIKPLAHNPILCFSIAYHPSYIRIMWLKATDNKAFGYMHVSVNRWLYSMLRIG